MLKTILVVTISVLRLGTVETAYEEQFGYHVVERGIFGEQLSEVWNAPAMADNAYVLMQPSSKANVFIRFVENEPVEGYGPFITQGWNATELLAKDPDAIESAMADSPFEVVGPSADLWNAPDAPRAMQAVGPADELLYLTRNNDFEIDSDVDRVFIMVVGGPSLDALSDFYGGLGMDLGDPLELPVPFMAKGQGLAPDHMYPLRVAFVSRDFLLELDQYPDTVPPRPVLGDHLPPGTSMVSFEATNLEAIDTTWRAAPQAIQSFPYDGRRVAVTVGPAGEWLEIIETPADN